MRPSRTPSAPPAHALRDAPPPSRHAPPARRCRRRGRFGSVRLARRVRGRRHHRRPRRPPPSILEDEAAFVGDATARPPPRRLPSARSRKKQAISIFVGKKDKYGGEGELDASKRLRVLAHRVGYSVRPSRRRVARHPDDGGRLRLLRDVTAVFEPGEVTALMGPSGAGKTTLLDVISGRKTAGEITGRVLLGPECVPATKDVLKSVSAYVEQNDALLANLTVRETLLYQAELKCDPAEPAAVRETYVDKLLELLKLTPCRDVAVGDAPPAASPAGNPNARTSGSRSSRVLACSSSTNPRAGSTPRRPVTWWR